MTSTARWSFWRRKPALMSPGRLCWWTAAFPPALLAPCPGRNNRFSALQRALVNSDVLGGGAFFGKIGRHRIGPETVKEVRFVEEHERFAEGFGEGARGILAELDAVGALD